MLKLSIARLVPALLGIILPATAVLAQEAAAPSPPSLSRSQSPLMGYFFMFLLTIVVIAVSLMPSKRSHQD